MLLVAMIGILSSLAVPKYMRFQLKSKTAEGKVNLSAIQIAQAAYLSEFAAYVPAVETPPGDPGSRRRSWPSDGGGFDTLGWSPEGPVYFHYAISTDSSDAYSAIAIADLDGNGIFQAWGFVHPNAAGSRIGAVHGVCKVEEVAVLNHIGPCDVLGDAIYGGREF